MPGSTTIYTEAYNALGATTLDGKITHTPASGAYWNVIRSESVTESEMAAIVNNSGFGNELKAAVIHQGVGIFTKLERSFFSFDLDDANIPQGEEVTQLTLKLYCEDKTNTYNTYNDTFAGVHVCDWTPYTDEHTLVPWVSGITDGDYTAWSNGSHGYLSYSGIKSKDWNEFDVDIDTITAENFVCLSLVLGYDFSNQSPPFNESGKSIQLRFDSVEETNGPQLLVEYDYSDSVNPIVMII